MRRIDDVTTGETLRSGREEMPEQNQTAAIAVVPQSSVMLRPIAPVADIMRNRSEVADAIMAILVPGTDIIRVPGAKKDSLAKAGAESACLVMGCRAEFDVVASEIDHDRLVTYEDRYKGELTSRGLYRFVVRCRIIAPTGVEVGQALGSCSTMESKYVSRPRECENTALKMAEKRAFTGATLHAFRLSDRLTCDIEDTPREQEAGVLGIHAPRDNAQRGAKDAPAKGQRSPKAVVPVAPVVSVDTEGDALARVLATMGDFDGAVTGEEIKDLANTWLAWLASPAGEACGVSTRWGMQLYITRAMKRLKGEPVNMTSDQQSMVELLRSTRARAALDVRIADAAVEGDAVEGGAP